MELCLDSNEKKKKKQGFDSRNNNTQAASRPNYFERKVANWGLSSL